MRRREALSGGEPDERPLAIVERAGGLLRLVAVDARAAAAGCVPGAALTHARSVCPDLRVDTADPREDAALLGAVADWCDRYTPLVALDPPFGLTLDISGCAHFFGGEAALAEDLVAGLRRQGFMARAAVAGVPGPARALAWFSQGAVPPPGSEAGLVAELPEGLDTLVGEGARGLSGGQAHRVALARVMLDSCARVLVFDEPTAHLDIETERDLKKPMLAAMEGRLVLFATHRLHWMADMDVVIELADGRIVQEVFA